MGCYNMGTLTCDCTITGKTKFCWVNKRNKILEETYQKSSEVKIMIKFEVEPRNKRQNLGDLKEMF